MARNIPVPGKFESEADYMKRLDHAISRQPWFARVKTVKTK